MASQDIWRSITFIASNNLQCIGKSKVLLKKLSRGLEYYLKTQTLQFFYHPPSLGSMWMLLGEL